MCTSAEVFRRSVILIREYSQWVSWDYAIWKGETLLFTLYVQYIVGYGNVHTVFTMKAPAMWASGFPFIVCE